MIVEISLFVSGDGNIESFDDDDYFLFEVERGEFMDLIGLSCEKLSIEVCFLDENYEDRRF